MEGSLGAGSYTNTAFSIEGSSTSPISPVNVCDWTSGYSKGTTTIQIANCGSTTPALGALSNLQVGSLIVLDQVDPVADNATAWNCAANYTCANAGSGGFIRNNGPCVSGSCFRSQAQGVKVTSITTTGGSCTPTSPCIGITPGLYMPTWASVQKPQIWFGPYVQGDSIENITVDASNTTGLGHTVDSFNCYQCWISGVRLVDSPRSGQYRPL